MVHIFIFAAVLIFAETSSAKTWKNGAITHYSNDGEDVAHEMSKMEARRSCLKAAKEFYFKGKTLPDSPLSSIEGKVRVSGDFDQARRKFVWDGNRIVMQTIHEPQWWVIRDCKAGIVKGEECKPKAANELLWTSANGVLDKENSVMLGPAMDNLIGHILSTANLSVNFVVRRDEAAKTHVERAQKMFANCKGLRGVMVPEGKSKLNSDAFINKRQMFIETSYTVMGQYSHLYPRKTFVPKRTN
jgi:hypothetical protein